MMDCIVVPDGGMNTSSEDPDLSDDTSLDNFRTIQHFFAETAKISRQIPFSESDLGPLSIFSTLRPYQRETVHWMIDKERNHKNIQIGPWHIAMPSGGILADEMGLGKTVELLACILGNSKRKEPSDSTSYKMNSSVSSAESNLPQKRKSTSVPAFLKKKPRLSNIKQNPVLKKGIESILHDQFLIFKNKVIDKRTNVLSEKCRTEIEISFKVLLLNRFFYHVTDSYIKHQVWGYLISEYEVDRTDSSGYLVLLEDSKENDKPTSISPKNELLNNDETSEMLTCINKFFSDSVMKKFEKEFRSKIVYSLAVASTLSIPLLERDDMRCRCGSNKVFGEKITCTKCGLSQHLQCVGLSVDDDLNDYKCPVCWMNEPPIESAATLIMVPPNLAVQWQNEIIKHAGDVNLKVFLYEGVNKNYLLPPLMAQFDIVLVTFTTLRMETSFLTNQTRSLRHMKRYNSFVTPLTCINWWRACIDEAQIVETINQVSMMTAHLKFVHSWAVTGTPIEKSLHDLYGLTSFLRIQEFLDSPKSWNTLVTEDQSLLHQLFAHLMRRRTKMEVRDQLALPQLTTSTTWLSFPPVEGYFYKFTHNNSMKTFLQKLSCIDNINQPLKRANPRLVSALLKPLLSLRQACVYPFLVNSTMSKFNLTKKSTMRELLPKMTKKSKSDCEDALRLYVMYVNGAAAIHMGNRNFGEAITQYRNVLTRMKGFEQLSPDSFQMIHIMHNSLEAASEEPAIELSDDEKDFSRRIEELEKKLLGKKQELVEARQEQLNKFSTEMENALNGNELNTFSWWNTIINRFNFGDILPKIQEALETRNIELTNAWKMKLRTSHHLLESLKYWLSDVAEKRSLTMLFLKQITDNDRLESLWYSAENCHIRKPEPRGTCLFCRMENIMLKYEALIFNMGAKEEYRVGDKNFNPIDWKMSASECILHVLVSLYRSAAGQNSDSVNANNQLLAVELLKKEFKQIRAVWSRQNDLIHVYDEIRMAKSIYDITAENALEDSENLLTEHKLLNYEMKSNSAYQELQSKYGSLQYLKNLEKKYENPEDIEESCPVCQNAIDETRAVLVCGHFTCYNCMQSLVEHGRFLDRIQCPMCRIQTPVSSITHVYGGGTSECDMSHVKGAFPIKIRAITAKILDLVHEDKDVKILLFSTWNEALTSMEFALKVNEIPHVRFTGSSSLTSFKTKRNVNVLLLLLRSGSKGLNITEASHVIFAEPALNLSDENQAIGRIYRLGQSKNMTVHKFVIKSSVEHQIYRMNEEMKGDSEAQITFRHLRDLFDKSFGK